MDLARSCPQGSGRCPACEESVTLTAGGPDDREQLGRRIRELRHAKGLSARDLAARSGLTATYISRLENAKLSPTVATLGRLVDAMGETITNLFAEVRDTGPVVRADERAPLRSSGVDDYRVTPGWTTRLEVLESIVAPGQGSGPLHSHPGDEECVLVLDGTLTLWLDADEHALGPGDSATFPCLRPHRWVNPGDRVCRALWIITPAVY
jgi:transcriptional regulator with XRE-family HTH domain